jgi:hypothetical protein
MRTQARPRLQAEFGVSVEIVRGVLRSQPLTVRRGRPQIVSYGTGRGINARATMRVYRVPFADYVLGGEQCSPLPGDKLIQARGTADEEVWEVFTPDDGTAPAVLISGRNQWEVQTRRIPNEAPWQWPQ